MIRRNIEVVGKTDEKGRMFLYGTDELNDFFSKFPNHRIVGEFRVFEEKTSPAMIGLYYQYFVPEFQQAFYKLGNRYTKAKVDEMLREMCIVTKEEFNENGVWDYRLKKVEELNNYELVEFLDELKQTAAENFNLILYDSRV